MKYKKKINHFLKIALLNRQILFALFICLVFFLLYSTLGVVKHNNFLSGYDLAVIDNGIWKYSQLQYPISTTHAFYDKPILFDHVELIFLLIAPFYWFINSAIFLIVLQSGLIAFSGLPIFLIAKKRGVNLFTSFALLISYLSFFGFQNAVWADVHSLVIGVCFLSFFVYFLECKNFKYSLLFLILSIISKEDMGLLTLAISLVYFLTTRDKKILWFALLSAFYLIAIFYIYFPHFTPGYPYANPNGILSDLNPIYMLDAKDKQEVIIYSLGWFGLLPLLSPTFLLPYLADLAHYFVLGKSLVTSATGLFMHYRSSLALLLVLPTIISISKFKFLNKYYIGVYLLICALFFQYTLHLPLSYLSKSWFWTTPTAVSNIHKIIKTIPSNASAVTQVNIIPHMTHREEIYTLWPTTKDFKTDSPCKNMSCNWFRWGGNPEYLIVDTSSSWDARHFLTSRENFIDGIKNLEIEGVIQKVQQTGNASLYKVIQKP